MLTLRAAKGPAYYERPEFVRDDYYAERGQVRGAWAGRGAQALGLSGGPDEGDLGMLLDGRDPASGAALAGTARRAGGNVSFDLTFAAPRSVSVLAAVGDEVVRSVVLEAHVAGVRAGLDYLEREACFVRRGRNGVTVLPAEGFVGALYVHEMARSGGPPPARAPGDRQPGPWTERALERPRHAPSPRSRQDRRHDRRLGDAGRVVAQPRRGVGAGEGRNRRAGRRTCFRPRALLRAGSPRAQVSPPSSARRAIASE